MRKVQSKDGTAIAFDEYGQGPALIYVGGATQHRAFDSAAIPQALAPHFHVYHFDRRGRGDSSDTLPFAVEREIEDIDALINDAGGSAFVIGSSSGGALSLEAALHLGKKITKLALYEPPYNADPDYRQTWKAYRKNLSEALAAGNRGDAAALFLGLVGLPPDQIEGMKHSPVWPTMEAIAPTLVMDGGASYPFMHVTAVALAQAIPNGQQRTLKDQTHNVSPDVLAAALTEFFLYDPK